MNIHYEQKGIQTLLFTHFCGGTPSETITFYHKNPQNKNLVLLIERVSPDRLSSHFST